MWGDEVVCSVLLECGEGLGAVGGVGPSSSSPLLGLLFGTLELIFPQKQSSSVAGFLPGPKKPDSVNNDTAPEGPSHSPPLSVTGAALAAASETTAPGAAQPRSLWLWEPGQARAALTQAAATLGRMHACACVCLYLDMPKHRTHLSMERVSWTG